MSGPTGAAEPSRETAAAIVDAYLDQLVVALAGRPEVRRTVAEAEEHLRDAIEDGVARGMTPAEAATAAVHDFGAPSQIARAGGRSTAPWLVAGRAAHLLLGVGLLAIGLSGLLAETFYRVWGPMFLAGDAPGVAYTAERCAQYRALAPEGGTCLEAAAIHHSGEVIEPRVAAGLLGLLVLVTYWWLARSRRSSRSDPTTPLVAAAAATAMFGVVAVAMLLQGGAILAEGRDYGSGAVLSAGLVSGVFCLGGLVVLRRCLARGARLPYFP